jgi:hypothetical protein
MAIESPVSESCVLGERVQEELVSFLALSACRFKEAADHAVILQALGGASAMDDFAHDHHWPQAAFGLVVAQRHIGPAKAGEEMFLPSV